MSLKQAERFSQHILSAIGLSIKAGVPFDDKTRDQLWNALMKAYKCLKDDEPGIYEDFLRFLEKEENQSIGRIECAQKNIDKDSYYYDTGILDFIKKIRDFLNIQ